LPFSVTIPLTIIPLTSSPGFCDGFQEHTDESAANQIGSYPCHPSHPWFNSFQLPPRREQCAPRLIPLFFLLTITTYYLNIFSLWATSANRAAGRANGNAFPKSLQLADVHTRHPRCQPSFVPF